MGEPVSPTINLTADLVMQRASDLLFSGVDPRTGFPNLEAVRAAQACVSMARELRLGRYGKASGSSGRGSGVYGACTMSADTTGEVASFTWKVTPGAVGYEIHLDRARTVVTPLFDNAVSDGDEVGEPV